MVKAVAVLGNSNDVSGTISFTQEGNGKFQQRLGYVKIRFLIRCTMQSYQLTCTSIVQVQPLWLEIFLVLSLVSMASISMPWGTPQMVACQLVKSFNNNLVSFLISWGTIEYESEQI